MQIVEAVQLEDLARRVSACRRCPRLVEWRETVAEQKRRAFADEIYWGRPVAGWGDARARCLVVGLAPAAHGANRTGRMFTGDESGRWLYRALYRAGFANQPNSVERGDGLRMIDCYVTAVARCAPPANRLTPVERENCRSYLEEELNCLKEVEVIVALGQVAYDSILRIYRQRGHRVPSPKPRFTHNVELALGPKGPALVASYHPSQQNTFTGKLTEKMFDAIFERARAIVESGSAR